METEVQEIGDKGKRRPPGSVAQGRPPFPSGRWPHSPPVLSLSQTASCLCLCCRCLHSSFHCCPASGPFGKVQSICPEDSSSCSPPSHPRPCGLGLPHLDTWSWLPTFEDPCPHPCGYPPHPPACRARMPPSLSRSQIAAPAQCTASWKKRERRAFKGNTLTEGQKTAFACHDSGRRETPLPPHFHPASRAWL